jgi:hypothetical protein
VIALLARRLYPQEPRFIRERKVKLSIVMGVAVVMACIMVAGLMYSLSAGKGGREKRSTPTLGLSR